MIAERLRSAPATMIDKLLGRDMSYAALRQRCAQLERDNSLLRVENARLKAENRHLRRKQGALRKEVGLVREAYFDAACLCTWHVAGLATSRRACYAAGMSPRKWVQARALLQVAHVHDGRTLATDNAEVFYIVHFCTPKPLPSRSPSSFSAAWPATPRLVGWQRFALLTVASFVAATISP